MSKQITGSTQVTNKEILLATLKEQGITGVKENGDTVSWGEGYRKCTINFAKATMSHDDMYGKNLNGVMQHYTKNLIKNAMIVRGHKVTSIKTLKNGQIEIIGSY